MKNNIVYDFADEAPYKKQEKINIEEENHRGLKIKHIEVKDEKEAYHKKGNYFSFEIEDFSSRRLSQLKLSYICKHLHKLMTVLKVKKNPHVLVVGLGNDDFSSDALGPLAIKNINTNSHLEEGKTKISCIIPGVMKTTGLESASIIKSLVKEFSFDFVIVIDSLTTRNVDRLYKVIQVTDTEIIPGSGINNFRKSLNSSYLGVPLVAVGVSMAICYSAIVENILGQISIKNKPSAKEKRYFITQLEKDLVLTEKDTEIQVKMISENIASIINYLFVN